MERPITTETVEMAYAKARKWQKEGALRFAEKGMRIARARDPRLLRTLEQCSNVMTKFADNQSGETRRASKMFSDHVTPVEVQLFAKAYEVLDRDGTPEVGFQWIYAAAAYLAGLNEE